MAYMKSFMAPLIPSEILMVLYSIEIILLIIQNWVRRYKTTSIA